MAEIWDIRENYVNDGYVVQNRTGKEYLTRRYYHRYFWTAKWRVRRLQREEKRLTARRDRLREWNERNG